ncbi:MAG: 3,4-dihydroxy-2-butanone-4-phosphate synthase, partial [Mesorhizobium sp.]
MPYDQKKIVEALRAFERGEIVVVMDDDGRENEGDLIVAAV